MLYDKIVKSTILIAQKQRIITLRARAGVYTDFGWLVFPLGLVSPPMRAPVLLALALLSSLACKCGGEPSVNWVAKGFTPPVVNQGQSGNVVAFVATELVESDDAVLKGKLTLGDVDQVCASGSMTESACPGASLRLPPLLFMIPLRMYIIVLYLHRFLTTLDGA